MQPRVVIIIAEYALLSSTPRADVSEQHWPTTGIVPMASALASMHDRHDSVLWQRSNARSERCT